MLWLKAVVFAARGSYAAMGETIQAAGKMIVRAVCMALLALTLMRPAFAGDDAAPFVAAFRAAFEDKDLGAALNLFCWAGIDGAKRRFIVGLVERDLARELAAVSILALDAAPTEFVIDGVVNRPNAPVVGHLLADFAEPGGGRHFSLHMLGETANGHCIALAVPELES